MIILRHATLADGSKADVTIDGDRVSAIGPSGKAVSDGAVQTHDLSDYLLIAAPAEPHAHLDKALTADSVPNPSGDLLGAITAWRSYAKSLTVDEIAARAEKAAKQALAHGVTAIRTHVDLGEHSGLRAVTAVLEAKDHLRGLIDLQIVGLVAPSPAGGDADRFPLLESALEMGIDVVGGAPWLDDNPHRAVRALLEIAANHGCPIDLHLDETLATDSRALDDLIDLVKRTGFPHHVTASHCVSLGMQDPQLQEQIAAAVAGAGISVVTLPLTNLFLQGRDQTQAVPRGLTAVRALLEAGATLAAGADNVRDPFNTMGSGDPLVTAGLLVVAGHLEVEEAYAAVSIGARAALGLEPAEVRVGALADLLAVRAGSLDEAIAVAPADRLVFRMGRLVAKTTVDRWIAEPGPTRPPGTVGN